MCYRHCTYLVISWIVLENSAMRNLRSYGMTSECGKYGDYSQSSGLLIVAYCFIIVLFKRIKIMYNSRIFSWYLSLWCYIYG